MSADPEIELNEVNENFDVDLKSLFNQRDKSILKTNLMETYSSQAFNEKQKIKKQIETHELQLLKLQKDLGELEHALGEMQSDTIVEDPFEVFDVISLPVSRVRAVETLSELTTLIQSVLTQSLKYFEGRPGDSKHDAKIPLQHFDKLKGYLLKNAASSLGEHQMLFRYLLAAKKKFSIIELHKGFSLQGQLKFSPSIQSFDFHRSSRDAIKDTLRNVVNKGTDQIVIYTRHSLWAGGSLSTFELLSEF